MRSGLFSKREGKNGPGRGDPVPAAVMMFYKKAPFPINQHNTPVRRG
jgi:hypothetical protein